MKSWMIVGASLMVVGLLLVLGVLFASGFQFSIFNTGKLTENIYTVEGPVNQVQLQGVTENVVFAPSDNDVCKVVCNERERMMHTVSLKDGKLEIQVDDQRKWYDYIGIFFGEPSVTVYLPAGEYERLSVSLDTGDVEVGTAHRFGDVTITTSTGDVRLYSGVQGDMNIQTSTGDIKVKGSTPRSMTLQVSTGTVQVEDVQCENGLSIQSSTGDVSLRDVTCGDLTMKSDTGDGKLVDVIASGEMNIRRSTGDVKLTRCDAAQIDIKTSTGDVTGSLRSGKIFVAHSSTGDVSVPESLEGGKCKITTSTGDIEITVG